MRTGPCAWRKLGRCVAPALVALACLAVTAHAAVRFGVTGGLQWTRVPWLASDAGDVPGPFPDQRTAWTGEAGLTAEGPRAGM